MEREVLWFVYLYIEKVWCCFVFIKDYVFCDGIKYVKEILFEIIFFFFWMIKIWKWKYMWIFEMFNSFWLKRFCGDLCWEFWIYILIWIFFLWYVILKVSLRGEILLFDEVWLVVVNVGGRKRFRWINFLFFWKFV